MINVREKLMHPLNEHFGWQTFLFSVKPHHLHRLNIDTDFMQIWYFFLVSKFKDLKLRLRRDWKALHWINYDEAIHHESEKRTLCATCHSCRNWIMSCFNCELMYFNFHGGKGASESPVWSCVCTVYQNMLRKRQKYDFWILMPHMHDEGLFHRLRLLSSVAYFKIMFHG